MKLVQYHEKWREKSKGIGVRKLSDKRGESETIKGRGSGIRNMIKSGERK